VLKKEGNSYYIHMEQTYQVKTSVFEGPLDLLLGLIEKRKLFINEISLTQVTDDYISYIKALPKVSMSDTASFIVIAATLILLKSKSLLPSIDLSEEEESSIEELEARLRMYKQIKEVSVSIQELFGKYMIFERFYVEQDVSVFAPDQAITKDRMYELAREVIGRIPKKEFFPEATVEKVINIEEMIEALTDRIQSNMNLSFKEFSKSGSSENKKEQKIYAIVSFLALLELVRQGLIDVIQDGQFDDIQISNSPESNNDNIENDN